MKKILCLLLCLGLLIGVLPLTVGATTTIDKVSLTLAYPEAGKTPPMTATWNGTGYSVYDIEWFDRETNRYLETNEKIQAGHQYVATIWVEASDGYVFKAANDNTPSITATVNGESVTPQKAYEYKAWAMVTLEYYFDYVPSNGWITSVDLTIPAPVTGAAPFYDQIRTASYSTKNVYFNDYTDPKMKNGISWYNTSNGEQIDPNTAETFSANTSYEFHCLVFPQENYRITRNAVVRVNGQRAEAYLDYGTFLSVSYTFPATGAASHTHFYTDWAWNSGQHYKNCTDCDDVFFVESHKGGVATCEEDGKCTVCGYAYIKASEDYHIPDTSKWVARGDMYHFHKCSVCGAHCDIEDHRWSPTYLYQDATGHAWICADCQGKSEVKPHTPGPEATETTPQTCKDCGYIIAPAKNHTHELTKVAQMPATCTTEGIIEHYTCSGCSDLFTDAEGNKKIPDTVSLAIGALGHEVSDTWVIDKECHWRTCKTCAAILNETKMLHEDPDSDSKCNTCGYSIGAEITPETTAPQDTEPTTPSTETDQQGNTPDLKSWLLIVLISLIALITLVCFGAAVTAVVIILKKKKKQGGKS